MTHILPITDTTTVTDNYTICITLPIRKMVDIKPKDKVLLSLEDNGDIKISKPPQSLEEWVGHGKEAFKKLGGAKKYLMKEKEAWTK